MEHLKLSDGEWKLMNQLWGKSPATITQLTERLAPETGWSKHTIITMLSRLEKKGAVAHRENGRAKEFWPVLDQADACKGTLPVRVNFILEEFCNMPQLDDIVPMLTAARSRNIRFHLVIQSYSQMKDKYNENVSRTIMDNCGNLIYLHTREISFLEYISKLAGQNEFDRPLLSVSRLQHLKKNETVIFHDRCYPVVVRDLPLIFEYPMKASA
mgnify:CR=1 FL=1